LYNEQATARWREIVGNRNVGLIIIGLPYDGAGREKVCEALRPRVDFSVGPALDQHLSGASWIWAAGKPRDNSTVWLRKSFELKGQPHPTWLQITADNRFVASVNGKEIGRAEDWRTPRAFDLSPLLRAGKNEIIVEGWNQDGPAGVIAAIAGSDPAGRPLFRMVTDATWEASADQKQWAPARAIAKLGEGPWESKVRESYRADEYLIASWRVTPDSERQLVNGRVAVLHGLTPGRGATTLMLADGR